LTKWKINIHGRKVTPDGTTPNPISNLSIASTYASSSVSPPIIFTASTSTDVVRYEVSIGTTSGENDVMDWTSIGTTTSGVQITGLVLRNEVIYYLNVRAVDNKENTSSVRTTSWRTDFL
jgi:hypothetical protein